MLQKGGDFFAFKIGMFSGVTRKPRKVQLRDNMSRLLITKPDGKVSKDMSTERLLNVTTSLHTLKKGTTETMINLIFDSETISLQPVDFSDLELWVKGFLFLRRSFEPPPSLYRQTEIKEFVRNFLATLRRGVVFESVAQVTIGSTRASNIGRCEIDIDEDFKALKSGRCSFKFQWQGTVKPCDSMAKILACGDSKGSMLASSPRSARKLRAMDRGVLSSVGRKLSRMSPMSARASTPSRIGSRLSLTFSPKRKRVVNLSSLRNVVVGAHNPGLNIGKWVFGLEFHDQKKRPFLLQIAVRDGTELMLWVRCFRALQKSMRNVLSTSEIVLPQEHYPGYYQIGETLTPYVEIKIVRNPKLPLDGANRYGIMEVFHASTKEIRELLQIPRTRNLVRYYHVETLLPGVSNGGMHWVRMDPIDFGVLEDIKILMNAGTLDHMWYIVESCLQGLKTLHRMAKYHSKLSFTTIYITKTGMVKLGDYLGRTAAMPENPMNLNPYLLDLVDLAIIGLSISSPTSKRELKEVVRTFKDFYFKRGEEPTAESLLEFPSLRVFKDVKRKSAAQRAFQGFLRNISEIPKTDIPKRTRTARAIKDLQRKFLRLRGSRKMEYTHTSRLTAQLTHTRLRPELPDPSLRSTSDHRHSWNQHPDGHVPRSHYHRTKSADQHDPDCGPHGSGRSSLDVSNGQVVHNVDNDEKQRAVDELPMQNRGGKRCGSDCPECSCGSSSGLVVDGRAATAGTHGKKRTHTQKSPQQDLGMLGRLMKAGLVPKREVVPVLVNTKVYSEATGKLSMDDPSRLSRHLGHTKEQQVRHSNAKVVNTATVASAKPSTAPRHDESTAVELPPSLLLTKDNLNTNHHATVPAIRLPPSATNGVHVYVPGSRKSYDGKSTGNSTYKKTKLAQSKGDRKKNHTAHSNAAVGATYKRRLSLRANNRLPSASSRNTGRAFGGDSGKGGVIAAAAAVDRPTTPPSFHMMSPSFGAARSSSDSEFTHNPAKSFRASPHSFHMKLRHHHSNPTNDNINPGLISPPPPSSPHTPNAHEAKQKRMQKCFATHPPPQPSRAADACDARNRQCVLPPQLLRVNGSGVSCGEHTLKSPDIHPGSLIPLRNLGRGAFGVVTLAMDPIGGNLLALKRLDAFQEQVRSQIKNELMLFMNVRHPNLLSCIHGFRDNGAVVMAFEYMDLGSLRSIVDTHGPVPEKYLKSAMRQVLQGLNHLHSHSIQHRDLKPANILAETGGRVIVADFGCARKGHELMNQVGTRWIQSPERLLAKSYGLSADVWSFGVSMIFCLTGQVPVPKDYWKLVAQVQQNPPALDRKRFSPEVCNLLAKSVTVDPRTRATASELLRQAFFAPRPSSPESSPGSTESATPVEISGQEARPTWIRDGELSIDGYFDDSKRSSAALSVDGVLESVCQWIDSVEDNTDWRVSVLEKFVRGCGGGRLGGQPGVEGTETTEIKDLVRSVAKGLWLSTSSLRSALKDTIRAYRFVFTSVLSCLLLFHHILSPSSCLLYRVWWAPMHLLFHASSHHRITCVCVYG